MQKYDIFPPKSCILGNAIVLSKKTAIRPIQRQCKITHVDHGRSKIDSTADLESRKLRCGANLKISSRSRSLKLCSLKINAVEKYSPVVLSAYNFTKGKNLKKYALTLWFIYVGVYTNARITHLQRHIAVP